MPVFIHGVDASGAVVEGEFGLDKPNMVAPKIISAPSWLPPRTYFEERYFPATGKEPGYGRYEIEPPANRKLPPPAQSFHRSWSSQSDPLPATTESPVPQTPLYVAPQIYPQPRGGSRPGEATRR